MQINNYVHGLKDKATIKGMAINEKHDKMQVKFWTYQAIKSKTRCKNCITGIT